MKDRFRKSCGNASKKMLLVVHPFSLHAQHSLSLEELERFVGRKGFVA